MKTPWKLAKALVLFALPLVTFAAQTDGGSAYSVSEVRAMLMQPPGFSSSFTEKQVNRLGDRVSIALMKIYSENDLTDPANIKKYLPLIVDAFRFPNLIAADDRQPRITLVLLGFLEGRVNDKDLQSEILRIKKLIVEETGSRTK